MLNLFLLAAAAAAPSDIVITASLEPIAARDTAASITVIDQATIDAQGLPLVTDLLRLTPGLSVATSGGRGAQAQVRVRGAEANHTLLFIDGIAFNDPAAGNEARFETLITHGLGRVEIIRGPQSALFGSEALGGVVALETPDPLAGTRVVATGEYGSRGFARGSVAAAVGTDQGGVSATASYLRDDGIDILGGGTGDRDGYENITASLKGVARPGENGEIGIVGRYIQSDSEFDGTDPVTFLRADTADSSRTETGAIRAWARYGLEPTDPFAVQIDGQYLRSTNHNRNGDTALNRTIGDRFRTGGQLVGRLMTGTVSHELIGRIEREDESFASNDQQYGGATNQNRTRGRTAFVGEWRGTWGTLLTTDFAVRRDQFNRFADATTFRGNAALKLTPALSVFGGYGEGIAQPTFFDLYGFFPGSFVGNPNVTTERSRGYEAGVRLERPTFFLSAAAFDNRLRNEIVSTFDNLTFLSSTANATGRSRRCGFELSGQVRPLDGLRVDASYTYLDAEDQQVAAGMQLREVRRPKHGATLSADYVIGPVSLGAAASYVGRRRDTDFDAFPAQRVLLDDYILGSARIGYRIAPAIEAFGRVENIGDVQYQDVVGYATPGRTVFGGVRLRFD
ncbi:TonB-dependent receptor plug domain-containing protein [Sphingomonas montana]|uniref:TonB-dependent receptor plug domain-containing protein n=1 Tax=Sphingomonas montana TaxID=1843236 RepID=UPI00096C0C86|nr:TonB-dependent receptor [Sphingomonas montana]